MSLVAPHLHEAVGVLGLHQVDRAGVVAILQGLQAISPWACRHKYICYITLATRLHPSCTPNRYNLQQRAKEHNLKGQVFVF